MCGLTGVFGSDVDYESLEAFRALASLSYLRGEHSTGVADYVEKRQGDSRKSFTLYKKLEKANDFFSPRGTWDQDIVYKRYRQQNKFAGPSAVMAHARAATIGEVKVANAHPFRCGDIIGMHNGTIREDFEGKKNFETDSEAIFSLINNLGAEAALQKLVDLHSAAFALTWYNVKEDSFNIFRNHERPLYFVKPAVGDEIFYSSDSSFLRAVLPYYNINAAPEIIPVLTHFKFDLTAKDTSKSRQEVKYSKKQEVWHDNQSFFQKPGRTGTNRSGNTTDEILKYVPYKTTSTTITNAVFDPTHNLTRINHTPGWYVSDILSVDEETYNVFLGSGCSCCGIVPADSTPVNMLQDGKSFICEACIKDTLSVEYAILYCASEMKERKVH